MGAEYPSEAIYNKLVRDRIPEIIQDSGLQAETRELGEEEVVKGLLDKILEEAKELSGAQGKDEVMKEMSDVLEVIYSLAERLNISMEEVEQLRQIRATKRGRFEKGIYLVRTYGEEK